MPTFELGYYETVQNYWTREVEADDEDKAAELFLEIIQGEEPDNVETLSQEWED